VADELLPDLVVKFKGDLKDLLAAFAEAKAAARDFGDEVNRTHQKTKKDTDGMGQDAKDFERLVTSNLKDGESAYKSLQRQIEATRTKTAQLRKEFSNTGSKGVFGDLKKAESDLKKLEGFAKDMGGTIAKDFAKFGTSAAESFGETFMSSFQNLPIGPIFMAIIIGSLIALSPLIISTLGAAVSVAFGAGVVGVALMAAMQNPMVKSAFKGLGATLKSDLADAVQGFIGPALVAAQQIAVAFDNMKPKLEGLFSAAGRLIGPLVDGLTGMVDAVLPGLTQAATNLEPVFAKLGQMLPVLGHYIGQFFEIITSNAPATILSFQLLIAAVGGLVKFIGGLVLVAEDALVAIEKFTSSAAADLGAFLLAGAKFLGPFGDNATEAGNKLLGVSANIDHMIASANTATPATNQMSAAIAYAGAQVKQLTIDFQVNTAQINSNTDAKLAADNATLALAQSTDAYQKALKENKHNWDLSTQSGQALYGAYLNQFGAIQRLYEQQEKLHPSSVGLVKDQLAAEQKLYNTAKAAGATKSELKTLADSIAALKAQIDKLKNKTVTLTVHTKYTGAGGVPWAKAQGGVMYAQGGVDFAGAKAFAQSGIANSAKAFAASGIYSGGTGSLVKFAEPSTGGEAYIARNGDRGRQLSTIMTALSWMSERSPGNTSTTYNAVSVGHGGGGGNIMISVPVYLDSQRIARVLVPANQRQLLRAGTSGQA